jgi:rare lipoprotein A
MKIHYVAVTLVAIAVLAGCSSAPIKSLQRQAPQGAGKYYLNDGPMTGVSQAAIDAIPEPVPRREPLSKGAKKPYVAKGRQYTPMLSLKPYRERGIGSWYGMRYNGSPTSNGEIYDAMKLTAAHPTLPLPSYVRVTNLDNDKSIVVRVNDRGPFLEGRLIDLSYAAAARLGFASKGRAPVEVELIIP